MEFRIANISDIEDLNKLYKKVIEDMEKKGINMWNEVYPFCEFEYDIANKNMYIMENEKEIIGSFVVTDFEDVDFKYINWNIKAEKWLSINRLAVIPKKQGNGYAKKAIQFIEGYARDNEYDSIRLTVYDKNEMAIGLYEKLGYIKVEEGDYIINGNKFVGYEKSI